MKFHYLASLTLLALPLAALAIEPGPSSKAQQETEHWLGLQVSGQAASPTVQQATATERELAMQRLLQSKKFAIPEKFDEDSKSPGSSK
ncbi:Protein of uncharacterised function (DUF3613) [Pseudomonas fluorescens]|uniref:Protein of uncharacterized function (DUF3613) n=1 Tax=Pseudomonas fluorescens TaxID=294 RepID=A0A379I728_PSEFL|nr:DUF3613 domain-containing protein [Pseudomonas fluorescens]AIG04589.1 hypothetical protein HZ99_21225 [Pseudomonas fluorescens]SUD28109.1 Protein of uncharacterised function (DUF3613) [Pseudomonas fluorescens]